LDIQEQVFFPMVSTKEDGSGLGLSISQDIIRIHGGAISFTTKSGETIFSILMPINIESNNKEVLSA
jgi:two-component system nitrogen regulation sensor histidine kinase GlnL